MALPVYIYIQSCYVYTAPGAFTTHAISIFLCITASHTSRQLFHGCGGYVNLQECSHIRFMMSIPAQPQGDCAKLKWRYSSMPPKQRRQRQVSSFLLWTSLYQVIHPPLSCCALSGNMLHKTTDGHLHYKPLAVLWSHCPSNSSSPSEPYFFCLMTVMLCSSCGAHFCWEPGCCSIMISLSWTLSCWGWQFDDSPRKPAFILMMNWCIFGHTTAGDQPRMCAQFLSPCGNLLRIMCLAAAALL